MTHDGTLATLRGAVSAIYGRLLTIESPVEFGDMTPDERDALLLTIESPVEFGDMTPDERDALLENRRNEIDADVEGLAVIVEQARASGVASLYSALRNAEGVDVDMVDELIATLGDDSGGV